MNKKFGLLWFYLLCLGILTSVWGQGTTEGGKVTVKGFVSSTVFLQNQSFGFGNGQCALFPTTDYKEDKWIMDGDIRNSRITLAFGNYKITDTWEIVGVLEGDFFGGYNGAGFASDEQSILRLRLSFLDIKNGKLTLRIGQFWSPLFGNVPVSLTHVAFPLGYGSAGFPGWRFPGIALYYKMSDMVNLQIAAMRGSWTGPVSSLNSLSSGNASPIPQIEARLNLNGKTGSGISWSGYVVGHYDQKDLSGVDSTNGHDELTGLVAEIGLKVQVKAIMLQGNAYVGENAGQQFINLTQLQSTNKDASGAGAWAQLGVNLAKPWTTYLFYGNESVDKDKALQAFGSKARISNQTLAASIKFQPIPRFGIGLEWLRSTLKVGAAETSFTGDQISLSSILKF